jgi:hypothetical protein
MRKHVLLVAALVSSMGICTEAGAQSRCRVMDPTGTALNVRTEPNGPIASTLSNGVLVTIISQTTDAHGKAWSFVGDYEDNHPLGWVFREFIACF